MEWIVIAFIGVVVGGVGSLGAHLMRMPTTLCIGLGLLGAFAGAAICQITSFTALGNLTVYVSACLVSIGLLAGGLLSYSLTNTERRV